jgi:hypothetical protein
MPTEAVDTGLSDQELFDEANADEAPADEAAVEAPEAQPEQEAQPHRDEQGRFASKEVEQPAPAAEVQAEALKPAVDDNAAMVPSWRVREINEEKRALAEKVAAFEAERRQWQQRPAPQPAPVAQEKAEPPDPLLDPVGYREFIRNELREERLNERREESLAKAHEEHKEEFEEAYAAAQKAVDPALKARMQQSRDPGKTLIQWHRERKTMAEVGTDPNAFFEKRFEAYLSDPANQAKVLERIRGGTQTQPGAARQAAPVNLPPSLTRATNASANISADDDDISNDGLWRHANG